MFRAQAYPYNKKGFKEILSLALLLTSFFGAITWFLAPEDVECFRENGAATCSFTRKVWRLGVYQRTLANVTDAVVLDPPTTSTADTDSDPIYHATLLSRMDRMESVAVDDRENAEEAVKVVKAFLADPGEARAQASLAGQPGAIRTIALWALVIGLSLVPLWVIGFLFPFTRPY